MANKEVCEVFIEQQIEESLQEGKKPYQIGKELSAWVEKLFAAKIPPDTLRVRADRAKSKLCTNVHSDLTPEPETEKESNQTIKEGSWTREEVAGGRGGTRVGAGRPRGSDQDWRTLYESIEIIKQTMKELNKLRVDEQHRIVARDLCASMSEMFMKLSTKLSIGE